MNKIELDILNNLSQNRFTSQREVAESIGYSLGAVNKTLKTLSDNGYIDEEKHVTVTAKNYIAQNSPRRAVILAAGFGMRMVPINLETPKALLEVKGQALIERLITQLHQVGITEIYVVVGFMKECFEYLIDDYGVKLITNVDYAVKNNLYSAYLARNYLDNAYVIPSDIYCEANPFHRSELYSWYMISREESPESTVRINRKNILVPTENGEKGLRMVGIAYISDASALREKLCRYAQNEKYNNEFWETALFEGAEIFGNFSENRVVEINTYEQLREFDSDSRQLKSDAIDIISNALALPQEAVTDITVLKKGMTNRSFLFSADGKRYIMRIPGEGTEQLINRTQEAAVYDLIKDKNICDNIVYMNPTNGYKITEYIENARVCDPDNEKDIKLCMERLRGFHDMKLTIGHTFDIFGQIDFYESLWQGKPSVFRDYPTTKQNVLSLKNYIEKNAKPMCLTHIDAVPDNFLFTPDGEIRLIDWEYAGMQDPDVDIAMFCIYSLYERDSVDRLIDAYYPEKCSEEIRTKIYCYIASCGLLWSNWCEYKRQLGVEFGEYALRQYRYAKEYYRIVQKRLAKDE